MRRHAPHLLLALLLGCPTADDDSDGDDTDTVEDTDGEDTDAADTDDGDTDTDDEDTDTDDTDAGDTDSDTDGADTDTAAPWDTSMGCPDDAQEPNDDKDGAIASTGGTDRVVCRDGYEDWWSFSVPDGQTATVQVTFPHADGDIDIVLESGGGGLLALSTTSTDDESVSWTNSGVGSTQTVYLRVYLHSSSTSWTNTYDWSVSVQ